MDGHCAWCKMFVENTEHVLFNCAFAKQVWEESGVLNHVQTLPNETTVDIFKRVFKNGTKEHSILVALFCWSI